MKHHRFSKYFPLFFLIADLLCLIAGYLVASYYTNKSFALTPENKELFAGIVLIWVAVFYSTNLQKINRNSRLLDHLNKVLSGLVINLSIVFALWFFIEPQNYSRPFFFTTYFVFTLSILFWRTVWHYTIRYYRTKGFNYRNVLILGKGELSDALLVYFMENPVLGYRSVGVVEGDIIEQQGVEVVENKATEEHVDVIFCCLPELDEQSIKDIIDYAENHLIKIHLISQFSKLSSYNLTIEQFGSIPIINVNSIPLDQSVNKWVKRSFDVIFSGLVLLFIFSWLIPIIGLLIKMESKGPVFFRQNRHGKGNRQFQCWKFRTMTHSEGAEFKQAKKNDHRITKIGAVLRKTSIDELPQFINVFLGDMSVVGPRPHPIKLNEEFQPKIDRFWQRHAVKPGITGLAQAKGFRGETAELSDMSGRVKLDRFYVKNWSLVLDFKIILLTVLSIIKGSENAY